MIFSIYISEDGLLNIVLNQTKSCQLKSIKKSNNCNSLRNIIGFFSFFRRSERTTKPTITAQSFWPFIFLYVLLPCWGLPVHSSSSVWRIPWTRQGGEVRWWLSTANGSPMLGIIRIQGKSITCLHNFLLPCECANSLWWAKENVVSITPILASWLPRINILSYRVAYLMSCTFGFASCFNIFTAGIATPVRLWNAPTLTLSLQRTLLVLVSPHAVGCFCLLGHENQASQTHEFMIFH